VSYTTTNQKSTDGVKVCNRNLCIDAKGDNAKLITGAFALMLICFGIAALVKAA